MMLRGWQVPLSAWQLIKTTPGRLVTSLSVSQVISPLVSNAASAESFTSFQERKKKK